MSNQRTISAGSISNYLQMKANNSVHWQLRFKSVCASTEIDLSNWLLERPMLVKRPRAVFAACQRYGIGQKGRNWHSPKGGIWLSAAFPCEGSQENAGLFGLAIAYAMCERLESHRITTQIKWPNDLFFSGKKLAGFLPKLIFRGENFRLARVGIGMNIINRTPSNAISLSEILGVKSINLSKWSAELIFALERAVYLLKEEKLFYLEAEKKLLKDDVIDPINRQVWEIDGLDITGGLKLKRGNKSIIWNRWN